MISKNNPNISGVDFVRLQVLAVFLKKELDFTKYILAIYVLYGKIYAIIASM